MRLIHNNIVDYSFDFEENHFQSLVIENSNEFYSLTSQLYLQCEKGEELGWVLSKNNREESLSKKMLLIHNYYQLDCTGKKIENLVNQTVLDVLTKGDYYERLSKINSEISLLSEEVLSNIDLPIQNDKEMVAEDIVKALNFQIREDLSFIDKIVTYIDIFVKLKKIKIVCFVNLFSVLSKTEIELLLKQLQYMELYVLFVDSDNKYSLDNAKKTIIDEDLCVI